MIHFSRRTSDPEKCADLYQCRKQNELDYVYRISKIGGQKRAAWLRHADRSTSFFTELNSFKDKVGSSTHLYIAQPTLNLSVQHPTLSEAGIRNARYRFTPICTEFTISQLKLYRVA